MACEIDEQQGPINSINQVIYVINQVIGDINACLEEISGSNTEEHTSDVGITAGQVVYIKSDGKIDLADKDAAIDFNDVLGVANNSATAGNPVTVVTSGLATVALGSVADTFWLGNSGGVVTTAPTSGTILKIGVQSSSTDITVKMDRPLRRA
jgi:ligand-binding sensor domain-containing protein